MLGNEEYKNTVPHFSEIIPFFDFSYVLPTTFFTLHLYELIVNEQKEIEKNQLMNLIETFRSFTFNIFKKFEINSYTLGKLLTDIKSQIKKSIRPCFSRRLNDQIFSIKSNILFISQINNLKQLLIKKYPEENFDENLLAICNYALSSYISESSFSNELIILI